jgi:hypothetical protein
LLNQGKPKRYKKIKKTIKGEKSQKQDSIVKKILENRQSIEINQHSIDHQDFKQQIQELKGKLILVIDILDKGINLDNIIINH